VSTSSNLRRAWARTLLGLVLVGQFVGGQSTRAAIYTWNNVGNDWGTVANWSSSVPGAADTGQFTSPSYSFQPALAAPFTVGGIWDNGNGAVMISGSAISINGTNINGNAATGIEMDSGAGSLAISNPVNLGGAQTWLNNSGNLLAVSGNIANGGFLLTVAGSSNAFISGMLSGAGGLTMNGSGNVTLGNTAANTFSGATTINSGTLTVQGGPNGNPGGSLENCAAITVNNGATLIANSSNSIWGTTPTAASGKLQINAGGLVYNSKAGSSFHMAAIILNGGTLAAVGPNAGNGSWNFQFGLSTPGDGSTSTISGGNASLNEVGGSVFNIGAGDTLNVNAVLAHVTAGGTDLGMIKSGPGEMFLTLANTYTSTTTINGGTLALNFGAAGAPGANIINSATNASSLSMNGGQLAMIGLSGAVNSQSFNGLTIGGGFNSTIVATEAGGGTLSATFGAIARSTTNGGTINFTLPTNGVLTTSSLTFTNNGILVNQASNWVDYATANQNTWASNTSGTIGAFSAYTAGTSAGAYNGTFQTHIDATTTGITVAAGNTISDVRFNNPNVALTLAGVMFDNAGGILVTPSGSGCSISGGSLGAAGGQEYTVFNYANQFLINSVISNSGATNNAAVLTIAGTGTSILTAANTYTGATNIDNGATLQFGNSGATGTPGTGVINDNGTLAFAWSSANTIPNVIRGAGMLADLGSGTLTLTGSNLFTGGAAINPGNLVLAGTNWALGTGSLALNGGTLSSNGASNWTLPNALVLSGTTQLGFGTATGGLTFNAATGTLTANSLLTLSSPATINEALSGAGFSLTKTGNGNLTIGGANTFSGGMNVNGGTVTIAGPGGGNGSFVNSAITVNSGAELDLNVNDAIGYNAGLPPLTIYGVVKKINAQSETIGRPITLSGGTMTSTTAGAANQGAWNFNTGNDSISTANGTNNFIAGVGAFSLRTATCYFNLGPSSTLTISVPVIEYNNTSTAPLNLQGSGLLVLSASNNYSGATNISGGTFEISGSGSLTSGIAVQSGNYASAISNSGALIYNSSAPQTFSGAISGPGGLTMSGGANLLLSGPNGNYSGNTAVTNGTLQLGSATALGTGGLNVNGGSTLDLKNNSQSIGAVNLVNGNIVSSVGSPTLTGTSYSVQAGSIGVALGGAAALTMTGSGLVTLSAGNIYGGPTTISSGTLQLGTGVSGQDGSIAGTSSVTDNAALTYNTFNNQAPNYPISGSGSLTKLGPGSLVLGNATYTGPSNVNAGALYVNSSLSSTAAVTVAGVATLGGSGSVGPVTVSSLGTIDVSANTASTLTTSSLTFINKGTINIPVLTSSSSLALQTGSLTENSFGVNVQFDFNQPSISSGTYGLVGYSSLGGGSGTNAYTIGQYPGLGVRQQNPLPYLQYTGSQIQLVVTGNTPYWNGQQQDWLSTNAWTLNPNGSLATFIPGDNDVFDDSASTGSVSGTNVLINSSTVNPVNATFNNMTTAYTISGSYGIVGGAFLVMNGGGSLSIYNSNSYTGGTTVNAGQLNVNNPSAIGSGLLTINGGTLGNTSGGSIGLAANNPQTWGASFAFAGPNNLNLGTGAVTIAPSTALTLTVNSGNLTVGGAISGTGASLTVQGTGGLVLNGANTYNSGTFILSGISVTATDNNSPLGTGPVAMTPTSGTATLNLTGASPVIGPLSSGGAGASMILLGNAANSSATQLTVNTGSTAATFSGTIGDLTMTNSAAVGSLAVTGGGTLTLAGPNTYTGNTTLSGGLTVVSNTAAVSPGLIIMNGGGLQTTLVTVANNVQFNPAPTASSFNTSGGNNMVLTGNLTGSGTLAAVGGGGLYLANGNTGASGVAFVLSAGTLANLSAGPLTINLGGLSGNGSVLGNSDSSGGQVTYSIGALNINTTYGGAIVDSVGGGGTTAINVGGGLLALASTASTYSGGTTVSGGSLVLNPNLLNTGAGFLGSGTLTINAGATVASFVNGFGYNPGALIPVVINGGVLTQLAADSHLGATTLTGGTIAGTQFDPHFGFTTLPSSNTSVISSILNLQAANTFNVALGSTSPDLLISGVIEGAYGITKSGSGYMVVSGANTYTGPTNITAGTLQMNTTPNGNGTATASGTMSIAAGATFNENCLYFPLVLTGSGVWNIDANNGGAAAATPQPTTGNQRAFVGTTYILPGNRYWPGSQNNIPSGLIVVENGGQLGNGYNGTMTANLVISGSSWNFGVNGGDNNGALRLDSGANSGGTFAGTLTLAANAGVAVNASTGGTATISANISDGGQGYLLSIANGNIKFSGANAFGSLYIPAGCGAIAVNSATAFGGGGLLSNGTAQLNGNSLSAANLTGTGFVINGSAAAGAAVLNVGTDNTSTVFSGVIYNGGASALGLTKTGSGALSLTSPTSSFTGNLTVNSGTLQASGNGTFAASALGNVQVGSRTITVNNGGVLQLAQGNALGGSNLLADQVVTPIVINAGGSVVNTANFNNIIGPLTLSGGTMGGGAGAGPTYLTYQLAGGAGGTIAITVNTAPSLMTASGANSGFNMAATTTFNVAPTSGPGPDLTVSAPLGDIQNGLGPASLVKTGLGTMLLTASNVYTGSTLVSAGTLSAGVPNSLSPFSAVTVDTGGVLDVTAAPQNVAAISIGSTGTLNLYVGNLLTSSGSAGFALGSTLNISGSIAALPELLMTYSGSANGTFTTISYNGSALPGTDQLYYSSGGSLEIISTGPPTWISGSDNWSAGSNWNSGSQPNAPGQAALLNQSNSGSIAIALDVPVTLGSLQFASSTTSYALSGNTLTFNNNGGTSSVTVTSGTHGIGSLVLITSGNLDISASNGSVLNISGNIADDGGNRSLTLDGDGSGRLVLSGTNSYMGGTIVNAGTLVVDSTTALADGSSLTVGQGASSLFAPASAVEPASTAGVGAVPEPGTAALLVVGLLVGFEVLRKRKRILNLKSEMA
jgi:fibronectin-binding autotransporter adhesin